MPTRRSLLALLGGAPFVPVLPAHGSERVVRVGVLPFGTVGWEIETIRRRGFDRARGVRVEVVALASNEAARIAFQSGAVDAIVGDLLLAARLSSDDRPLKFIPFSATEGAVMVAPASPVGTIADLRGRTIGIAGGALDKSWILLQAYARQVSALDLAKDAVAAFAAAPLLAAKLEAGELDAAYLYWNFSTRLEAKGFRRLIGLSDILHALGVEGEVALLGYLCGPDLARDASAMAGFAAASKDAKRLLASSEEAWLPIRPLMQAPDGETFSTLKRSFVAGIPRRPVAQERRDAEALYALLFRLGGERLVGPSPRLPAQLYWDESGDG